MSTPSVNLSIDKLQEALRCLKVSSKISKLKSILGSPLFQEFLKEFPDAGVDYSRGKDLSSINMDLLEKYACVQWARHYLQTGRFGDSVPDLIRPPVLNRHFDHDPVGDIPFKEFGPKLLSCFFRAHPEAFLNESLENQIKITALCLEVVTMMQEEIESDNFPTVKGKLDENFQRLEAIDHSAIREQIVRLLPTFDEDPSQAGRDIHSCVMRALQGPKKTVGEIFFERCDRCDTGTLKGTFTKSDGTSTQRSFLVEKDTPNRSIGSHFGLPQGFALGGSFYSNRGLEVTDLANKRIFYQPNEEGSYVVKFTKGDGGNILHEITRIPHKCPTEEERLISIIKDVVATGSFQPKNREEEGLFMDVYQKVGKVHEWVEQMVQGIKPNATSEEASLLEIARERFNQLYPQSNVEVNRMPESIPTSTPQKKPVPQNQQGPSLTFSSPMSKRTKQPDDWTRMPAASCHETPPLAPKMPEEGYVIGEWTHCLPCRTTTFSASTTVQSPRVSVSGFPSRNTTSGSLPDGSKITVEASSQLVVNRREVPIKGEGVFNIVLKPSGIEALRKSDHQHSRNVTVYGMKKVENPEEEGKAPK